MNWNQLFDQRQNADIDFCQTYAQNPFGTDGHNRMLTIWKLARILDALERQGIDINQTYINDVSTETLRQVETP